MAQSILELAKQGDAKAIATLINRSIQPKGITATASLERECLNIDLRSAQTPNQKAVVALIRKGMLTLQVKSVKKLFISAYKVGGGQALWQTDLNLKEPTTVSVAPLPPVPVSLPEIIEVKPEIALVHQPVQIQLVAPAYQDIIIRFSDRHHGKIKCLCTLTELIEAINNFSCTAPQNLLEAIAESITTDQNGDRIIADISVLQPGSQWQKAKIRLAIKIIFEPEQYVPPESKSEMVITLDVIEEPIANSSQILLDDLSGNFEPVTQDQHDQQETITLDNFMDLDRSSPASDHKSQIETQEPMTLDALSSFW